MTLQDALHILRMRWLTVVVVTVAATIGAVAYVWLVPPSYKASTSIFITTQELTNVEGSYAASQFAQGRTVSYVGLIMSEALATRTVNRLNLDIAPRDLAQKVSASANTDSVVITLSVTDTSPSDAVSLANDLSDDFVRMVEELETPAAGGPPAARAVVVQRAIDSNLASPPRPIIIAFGVIAGLLLGIIVALLRGRPRRNRHTEFERNNRRDSVSPRVNAGEGL